MKEGLVIDGTVTIQFGETDLKLQEMIAPYVGPKTKVNIDPKMKKKMQ